MKEKTTEELVRNYLHGKLSPVDRDTFQNKLQTDPELAQELAIQRAETAASELLIAADARNLFGQWRTEKHPSRGFSGIKPLLWLGGIAAGVLLIFAAIRLFNPVSMEQPENRTAQPVPSKTPAAQNPPGQPGQTAGTLPEKPATPIPKDYRQLAAQLLPEPVLSTLRRNPADSTVGIFYQAEQAYSKGEFQETLELLEQTDSARWQAAAFLSAHALFKLRRFPEAETRFGSLAATKSRQFRYLAEWGVLMCRLADFSKQEKAFRDQLDEILTRPEHPYFDQAQTLKKKLKE